MARTNNWSTSRVFAVVLFTSSSKIGSTWRRYRMNVASSVPSTALEKISRKM